MALKLGRSISWLNHVEHGRQRVFADDLQKIAGLLGVEISDLAPPIRPCGESNERSVAERAGK